MRLASGEAAGTDWHHSYGRRRRMSRWRFTVIDRPNLWEPHSWDDVPPSGEVIMVDEEPVSHSEGVGGILAFNYNALKHPTHLWSVLLPDRLLVRPGDHCTQFCTHFD